MSRSSRIVWDAGAFHSPWADAKLCSTDAGDDMRAGKGSGIDKAYEEARSEKIADFRSRNGLS